MEIVDFLFQFAIILITTKLLGIILRKLGFPQVLGFIIAGVLIGPAIWGLIFNLNGYQLFPISSGDTNPYLKAFAEVGVIFVMFTAGLETDLSEIKNTGFVALLIALAGVLLPLGGGTLLGYLFLRDAGIYSWLFVGVIMTATSVGITVEVLRELGKLQTKVGTIIMSAAINDDVIGVMVLSIVLTIAGANGSVSVVSSYINKNGNAFISIAWILAFFVFAIGTGIGISKLFKYMEKRNPYTRRIPIWSIAVCFLYSFIAQKIFGVADITGAYIAGLVLSTNHASAKYVDRKVSISSYTIFAPIFFANIGMQITFKGFDLSVLWFAIAFVVMAIAMKIIGCGLTAKCFGYSDRDSLRIGVGMIARGEVALIVTQKGLYGGLIDAKYLTLTILLVLVSSVIAPIILKLLYKNSDRLPLDGQLDGGRIEQNT